MTNKDYIAILIKVLKQHGLYILYRRAFLHYMDDTNRSESTKATEINKQFLNALLGNHFNDEIKYPISFTNRVISIDYNISYSRALSKENVKEYNSKRTYAGTDIVRDLSFETR